MPKAILSIRRPSLGPRASRVRRARSPWPTATASRAGSTHGLLQYLPALDRRGWKDAAARFVAIRGAGLPPRTRDSIVTETLAVLSDPAFAALFGPDSRAEVPIVAEIARPGEKVASCASPGRSIASSASARRS